MASDLFDQAKFYLGLGVFLYAVWSLYGTKIGIGAPPDFSFDINPFDNAAVDAPMDGGPPAEANIGLYWGRPWRDTALPWTLTDFGENNPMKRLTIA